MKKYLVLILIVAFGITINSCKKTDTPTNPDRPLTLAERAGTYKTTKATYNKNTAVITIKLKDDGTCDFTANQSVPENIKIGDPTSTNTTFNFTSNNYASAQKLDWTIDFEKKTLQAPFIDYQSELYSFDKIA